MKHSYATESVGIATEFLITTLHQVGLATLTDTPSPMGFHNTLFHRPENERRFLRLVVGYSAEEAQLPDITRKPLEQIVSLV